MLQRIAWKYRVLRESVGLDNTAPADARTHLAAAIAWLKHAQEASPDDGVAQTYLVRTKHWATSYPETTGYIIPTFFNYHALVGDDNSKNRAIRMAAWEIEVQHSSGGVLAGALGDSDQPTVFNTGQVLFGWARALNETGDTRYGEALLRAASWLCGIQDADGCWRKFGSPMTTSNVCLYNTRSAWGLVRAHEATGEVRFLKAAEKNADWALGHQQENGWMAHNCLQDASQPYVHTIAYAMRGLLEIGAYTEREDLIQAACLVGDALLQRLPASGKLQGRFNAHWQPTVSWSCLTGNAQIAINWSRLYQLTGDDRYREAVSRINNFTKSTQKLAGPIDERGGIKGSHPVDGGYHPWQYPNWAAKFFADALMMEELIGTQGSDLPIGFKIDG